MEDRSKRRSRFLYRGGLALEKESWKRREGDNRSLGLIRDNSTIKEGASCR